MCVAHNGSAASFSSYCILHAELLEESNEAADNKSTTEEEEGERRRRIITRDRKTGELRTVNYGSLDRSKPSAFFAPENVKRYFTAAGTYVEITERSDEQKALNKKSKMTTIVIIISCPKAE